MMPAVRAPAHSRGVQRSPAAFRQPVECVQPRRMSNQTRWWPPSSAATPQSSLRRSTRNRPQPPSVAGSAVAWLRLERRARVGDLDSHALAAHQHRQLHRRGARVAHGVGHELRDQQPHGLEQRGVEVGPQSRQLGSRTSGGSRAASDAHAKARIARCGRHRAWLGCCSALNLIQESVLTRECPDFYPLFARRQHCGRRYPHCVVPPRRCRLGSRRPVAPRPPARSWPRSRRRSWPAQPARISPRRASPRIPSAPRASVTPSV